MSPITNAYYSDFRQLLANFEQNRLRILTSIEISRIAPLLPVEQHVQLMERVMIYVQTDPTPAGAARVSEVVLAQLTAMRASHIRNVMNNAPEEIEPMDCGL